MHHLQSVAPGIWHPGREYACVRESGLLCCDAIGHVGLCFDELALCSADPEMVESIGRDHPLYFAKLLNVPYVLLAAGHWGIDQELARLDLNEGATAGPMHATGEVFVGGLP